MIDPRPQPRPYTAARILILALIVAAPGVDAQIFRSVDKDGNVVFSDTPPTTADNGADDTASAAEVEAVELSPINQLPPVRREFEVEETLTVDDVDDPTEYGQITIVSPESEETVRNNAGNVQIVADLVPALRSGHKLQLIMNNEIVETIRKGHAFDLRYVDRGTHEVVVRVIDESGAELARSQASRFHLQRFFRR